MSMRKYGTGDGQIIGEDEKSAEQRRQELESRQDEQDTAAEQESDQR